MKDIHSKKLINKSKKSCSSILDLPCVDFVGFLRTNDSYGSPNYTSPNPNSYPGAYLLTTSDITLRKSTEISLNKYDWVQQFPKDPYIYAVPKGSEGTPGVDYNGPFPSLENFANLAKLYQVSQGNYIEEIIANEGEVAFSCCCDCDKNYIKEDLEKNYIEKKLNSNSDSCFCAYTCTAYLWAYQKDGYWLRGCSLIGPQGAQGETGDIGPPGEIGPQGEDGAQGDIGAQGEIGPQGENGEIGPQGPQGESGGHGTFGPQGEIGPQGEEGADGAIGIQGPEGPIGDSGNQGEMGPQGEEGEMGAQGSSEPGDIGPQGESGNPGETGPQGDLGNIGPQGEQGIGAQGPAGSQGNEGDMGPMGNIGPQGSNKGDIIPFASGNSFNIIGRLSVASRDYGPPAYIGFGNRFISNTEIDAPLSTSTITLNSLVEQNFSFVVPRDGIITRVFFTATLLNNYPYNSSVNVLVMTLYRAPVNNVTFDYLLTSPPITLFTPMPIGTLLHSTDDINIPVSTGERLLLVVFTNANNIVIPVILTLFINGGIVIV